jgi:hypothetical protein
MTDSDFNKQACGKSGGSELEVEGDGSGYSPQRHREHRGGTED